MLPKNPKIGFVGFGEVAYHFSKGLKEAGIKQIIAYDNAIERPDDSEVIKSRAEKADVELTWTLEELVKSAELIISSVWGNIALEVAERVSRFIKPGHMFADLNNATPSAKEQASHVIEASGANFVDIALFASPAQMKQTAFIYCSGSGAEEFEATMRHYGMNITSLPGKAGKATAIKTLANISYKGLQALYLELATTAYKAGIELSILEPLLVKPVENLPREKEMAFWIVRGVLHAERKAAESQEIVRAMEEWGVEPIMMRATVRRLNLLAKYKLKDHFKAELEIEDYRSIFEAIDKVSKERKI